MEAPTDPDRSECSPPAVSPGDAEIRRALMTKLAAAHRQESDTVFFQELGLCGGQVRADLAVVNGAIHGYEIKSDRDTLRRLAAQAERYNRVFDRVTLVVGPRHFDEAAAIIPLWWEIQLVELVAGTVRLRRRRTGRKNLVRDARTLVELLWLDDAIALIQARGGARGYRSRPRRAVWDRVCELYTLEEIASVVRNQLKARSAILGRQRFA